MISIVLSVFFIIVGFFVLLLLFYLFGYFSGLGFISVLNWKAEKELKKLLRKENLNGSFEKTSKSTQN